MRTTKKAVQAAIETIPGLIEQTVLLEQSIEELYLRVRANREVIKAAMIEHKITRQPTAAGFEALLIDKKSLSWNVAALENVLNGEEFEELCPRKAEGEKLRKLMEGSDAARAKELKHCSRARETQALELRPPAATNEEAAA